MFQVHNEKPIIDDGEFEEEGAEYQIVLRGDPTVKFILQLQSKQACSFRECLIIKKN